MSKQQKFVKVRTDLYLVVEKKENCVRKTENFYEKNSTRILQTRFQNKNTSICLSTISDIETFKGAGNACGHFWWKLLKFVAKRTHNHIDFKNMVPKRG